MPFHNTYRPQTLDRIIGHASAVAALKNFAQKGSPPSAILIYGPPSAGKTTLGRAFAREVVGEENMHSSFEEINLASQRSIEEIRGLVRLAEMRPLSGKRRFIMCDEAQGILGNAPAANALLKPLEEPIASTTWILSTMEPAKFMESDVGRAIVSRCTKIKLSAPTEEELTKFAIRIRKAEKIDITPEQTKKIAESCASFRDVANTLEMLSSADDLESALSAALMEETEEQLTWAKGLLYGIAGKYVQACTMLMGTKNGVGLLQTAGYMAWSLLALEVGEGSVPKGVWGAQRYAGAHKSLKKAFPDDAKRLELIAQFNFAVTQLKLSSGAFAVNEAQSICAMLLAFKK